MDLRVPLDVTGSSWWIINWNCSKNSQSFPLGQNTRPHTILILDITKMPTEANVSQQVWKWSQSLLTDSDQKRSELSIGPKCKAPHYLDITKNV